MTVQQVQAAATALAAQISQQIQAFEASTGCLVHSIPIYPATKEAATYAVIKVQISA